MSPFKTIRETREWYRGVAYRWKGDVGEVCVRLLPSKKHPHKAIVLFIDKYDPPVRVWIKYRACLISEDS